ncbi:hypothetical protein OS493_006690 [Desmophyllum pertusum]|uniref:Uncharacterized protein n=1 Tax=Desmophyllum pertusum TaxID=174260 RepID=A0A9X0D473_9CNID|nr:hypothetical protein OS493_006690 [Desmophyllum pertusum]
MSGEDSSKQGRWSTGSAFMDESKLPPQTSKTTSGSSIGNQPQGNAINSSGVPETTPPEENVGSVNLSLMRILYQTRGFSEKATNIVLQSWRQSSQKQYDAHIKKWLLFCTMLRDL